MITPKQLPKEIQLPLALQNLSPNPNGETLNLDDREKKTILKALAQTHGNKRKPPRF